MNVGIHKDFYGNVVCCGIHDLFELSGVRRLGVVQLQGSLHRNSVCCGIHGIFIMNVVRQAMARWRIGRL